MQTSIDSKNVLSSPVVLSSALEDIEPKDSQNQDASKDVKPDDKRVRNVISTSPFDSPLYQRTGPVRFVKDQTMVEKISHLTPNLKMPSYSTMTPSMLSCVEATEEHIKRDIETLNDMYDNKPGTKWWDRTAKENIAVSLVRNIANLRCANILHNVGLNIAVGDAIDRIQYAVKSEIEKYGKYDLGLDLIIKRTIVDLCDEHVSFHKVMLSSLSDEVVIAILAGMHSDGTLDSIVVGNKTKASANEILGSIRRVVDDGLQHVFNGMDVNFVIRNEVVAGSLAQLNKILLHWSKGYQELKASKLVKG